ncbi:uncharacterized protein BXIN_1063 [Babesia sp. Xinjiang]|uniref:uncharacterized protein n=1 Tax=Babesia sp. Xinjiang TaxID=462227 RepID=UPI000A225315|nr:uncharacterized protein BXIN_1063 [Babesia sp. Xinjiang]ORM41980.1 hypothetical protein BXIN_1063 [Babesia sp. Xinjiang]
MNICIGSLVFIKLFALLVFPLKVTAVKENKDDTAVMEQREAIPYVGCNFSRMAEKGMPPFFDTTDGGNTCEVNLKEGTNKIIFVCPGISNPWGCPTQVLHQGERVDMDTLMNQVTIRTQISPTQQDVEIFTAIVSHPIGIFTAVCTCELPDGRLYIMKIINGAIGAKTWTLFWVSTILTAHYLWT